MSSEPKPQELVEIHAMISRMRVLCSPQTVECAEKVMATTIDAFFAPDKTIRELDEAMKSGASIDPLTKSSLAARKELSGFYDFLVSPSRPFVIRRSEVRAAAIVILFRSGS
jgi:hypothetical protein